MKTRVFLGAIFLMSSPVAGQALPAFYGAEGGGSLSVGGRGGVVCQVTSLADSGSGTLRACVNMSGPRTVVFRVGGTINLASSLLIRNPYITIAGHTAPGGGIQLNGKNAQYTIRIQTHDVVIRYLRVRKGFTSDRALKEDTIGVNTSSTTHKPERIIFDHLSIFWGMDETLSFTTGRSDGHFPVRSTTTQNTIIAETLRGHSAAMLMSSPRGDYSGQMTNNDVHKNLFAFNNYRSPQNLTHQSRLVSNIIYHWGIFASFMAGGEHDVVSNLYKHPCPTCTRLERRHEIGVARREGDITADVYGPYLEPSIYAVGNKGPWHPDPSNNWDIVKKVRWTGAYSQGPLPAEYRRSSPLPPVGIPITIIPVSNLESSLLPIVGASRRLDCMGNWVVNRDAADTRIINHVINNYQPSGWVYDSWTGDYGITNEDEVGGFPTIAGGTPCADTDGDGMPDVWEDAMGLNKNNAADRNTIHSSGYTMLEMYLNGPMTTNTTITTPENVRFMQ